MTQPMSAVHQKTSSSRRSKTQRQEAYVQVRYPPVLCTIPLGCPVVPEVYNVNSGSLLSIVSGSHQAAASRIRSWYQ